MLLRALLYIRVWSGMYTLKRKRKNKHLKSVKQVTKQNVGLFGAKIEVALSVLYLIKDFLVKKLIFEPKLT